MSDALACRHDWSPWRGSLADPFIWIRHCYRCGQGQAWQVGKATE